MLPSPVPGEAPLEAKANSAALIRNVTLGLIDRELRLDAILDTGATVCVIPPRTAGLLGFDSRNRLRSIKTNVVGGQIMMDLHRLEYLRVGTAQAYSITFGIANTGQSRFMLLGLPFIRLFTTTVDFDEGRVLFRSRKADKR